MEAVYSLPGAVVGIVLTRWRLGRGVVWALVIARLFACVVIGGVNTFFLKHVHAGVVELAVAAVALAPVPHLLQASRADSSWAKVVALATAALALSGALVALITCGMDAATARMPNGELIVTPYSWKDLVGACFASLIAGSMALAPPLERGKATAS
jgi:hypothetical protein